MTSMLRKLDTPVAETKIAKRPKSAAVEPKHVDNHILQGKRPTRHRLAAAEADTRHNSLPEQKSFPEETSHMNETKECIINKKPNVRKHSLFESELERTLRLEKARLKKHEQKQACLLKAFPTISLPRNQRQNTWKTDGLFNPCPPVKIKVEPESPKLGNCVNSATDKQITSRPQKKVRQTSPEPRKKTTQISNEPRKKVTQISSEPKKKITIWRFIHDGTVLKK